MNNEKRDPKDDASKLLRVLGWLSSLPVAVIVLLTFADVFGRYVFSSPIRGSVEMIEFAMALLIFTALPLVTRNREHVTVSLIDGMVHGSGRRIKTLVCDAISAIALGVLTWRLGMQGVGDLASASATLVLGLPHAPLSFALTALAGITTGVMLVMLGQSLINQGAAA